MQASTIAKLIPRLASDHDGEVVATVRAIRRVLEADGLDLHDLAARLAGQDDLSTWYELALWCQDEGAGHLSEKEADFIDNMVRMLRFGGEPSEKQAKWMRDIYARLSRGG